MSLVHLGGPDQSRTKVKNSNNEFLFSITPIKKTIGENFETHKNRVGRPK